MSSMVEKKKNQKLAESLCKRTHFSKPMIEALLHKHKEICRKSKLDRTSFREILHNSFCITDDMIMDRNFKVFDPKNDGSVSSEGWVIGLSRFLKGNLEEKADFVFEIYDLNGDGFIAREEMYTLLKPCLAKMSLSSDDDPEEGVKDLVEMALKKLDKDGDMKVSKEDFRTAVREEPLLLECLGSVFPTDEVARIFLEEFSQSSNKK